MDPFTENKTAFKKSKEKWKNKKINMPHAYN